jgi:glyoxylase-like metal-dependent hydrolase (beta-lactamase superfamily II)
MGLAVDQFSLGQIGTNCYLVRAGEEASETVVVDPGDEFASIARALVDRGATCVAILLTHGHFDHFGALADLVEATGAPVWLPEGELDVFRRPTDFFPGVPTRAYAGDATLLSGGETVEAAGISFQVRHVPGHSPGHVSYYADGALFSGDVLFSGSVGRTDLPFGDWDTLLESIRTLAEAYPPETTVYSGHGPATTLADELARNPFLAELRAQG